MKRNKKEARERNNYLVKIVVRVNKSKDGNEIIRKLT